MRSVSAEVAELSDPTPEPSRLYTRPLELHPELAIDAATLIDYLTALGYRDADLPDAPVPPRSFFASNGETVRFTTRKSLHPLAPAAGLEIEVEFQGDAIRRLEVAGEEFSELRLEPVELYSYYDDQRIDRRDTGCARSERKLPETIARAIMAAEDDQFLEHPGVSVTGIARAAMANLEAGAVRQGGSTITQQLARNRFLTHERTWRRKAREALMALVLERRYEKDQILCAYADLVYLGVRNGVNIVGVGAAAATYFGKAVDDLTLAEAATLAGMVAAPGRYAPTRDLERSRARRDWVLGRLHELGWIGEGEYQSARKERLAIRFGGKRTGVEARYYADAVRSELERRHGVADLERSELVIDGTLDWLDQRRAERAIDEGVGELASALGKQASDDLQAALLSVDPKTGVVLSYVGGRDYGESQFDRVRQARRQVGSLFKPVVYATAFARRVAHPETPVADRPIAIRYGDELWVPGNSRDTYRGTVTARQALELSVNSATVRLAASTGLADVRRQASALGLEVSREPAVVLGAAEASPWEMAEVYATFARQGSRLEHTTIAGVVKADGRSLELVETKPSRVLGREAAHLVNTTLQGVLREGTGARAWRAGLRDPLAGKTGTSNDRRDSWFVGYSPDRLTVVWTGRDGFGETPFTGTTGALPLWISYTLAVRPHDGFVAFDSAGLDTTLFDFDNADVWPACPDEVLHPEYRCGETAGEDSLALEPHPRSATPPALANDAQPVESFASRRARQRTPALATSPASGSRRLDVRRASLPRSRQRTAPRPARAEMETRPVLDSQPEPALDPESYETRDYLELDRRGGIVERAVEWVPLTDDAR